MNINEIQDPHRIYPGQVLYLDKSGGRARLTTRRSVGGVDGGTIKLSPRTPSTRSRAWPCPRSTRA